jgi:predicted nuclease of restriction endonuclease-like (RecB) superfamily
VSVKKTTRAVLSFKQLVGAIGQIHSDLAAHAGRAVNMSLTIRNWFIGAYIAEYEQQGADRAQYGEALFERLSSALQVNGGVRYHPRELRRCRTFYVVYPSIGGTASPQLKGFAQLFEGGWFHRSTIGAAADLVENDGNQIRGTLSPELADTLRQLIQSLSFSHFVELIAVVDATQRRFYEVECLRGNWSVRELKRQIASLYYERSGLSTDKAKLALQVQKKAESFVSLNVRDPYVFEFLGLKPKEVMAESDIEDAILDNLQEFLLELGHGFCFEARQKRILIGDGYYFIDLVFYHRILKCHVLVELKLAEFNHENIGQLNTYVNWYRKNMTTDGDNPPIGILLCTQKDHALVEYAMAGMDNEIFVSKYLLELPKKEEMQRFIEAQLDKQDKPVKA